MNQLLISSSRCASQSERAAPRAVQSASQALLLARFAQQHQASDKLQADGWSRGALCKVVVAVSLLSIVLTSAVLVDMLGAVLPGIGVHVFR